MTNHTHEMRLYVASLSDYNAGILHGCWIDVSDKDTIFTEINAMLAESPTAKQEGSVAEEWAIHDYEGFGPLKLSEYESMDRIVEIAEAYEEHDEAFLHWADHSSDNCTAEEFRDKFRGEHKSLADYVQEYWEECGWKEEGDWGHPSHYVDWERLAGDWETNGDVWTVESEGVVYVFDS